MGRGFAWARGGPPRLEVLGLVLLAVVVSAGCTNLLTGETLQFEASPAGVDPDVAGEHRYALEETEWRTTTREAEAAGQSREAEVRSYASVYHREAPDGTLTAGVGVLATPKAEAAGVTFSPVADWSPREMIGNIPSPYGDLEDLEEQGTRTATILGSEETVTRFTATAADGDEVRDVVLHVAKADQGSDFVIGIAVHLQGISPDRAGVDAMFEAIRSEAPREPALSVAGIHQPVVDGVLYGHQPDHTIPEGKAAEWADAPARDLVLTEAEGSDMQTRLRAKAVGDQLYVALETPPELPPEAIEGASIPVDADGDGEPSTGDVRFHLRQGPGDDPTLTLEVLGEEGFDPVTRAGADDGNTGLDVGDVAVGPAGDGAAIEARLPLETVERVNERGISTASSHDASPGDKTRVSYSVTVSTSGGQTYTVGGGGDGDTGVPALTIDYITTIITRLQIPPQTPSQPLQGGVRHVEVMQGVQTETNTMPVVQGKDTLVRVFADHSSPSPAEMKVEVTAVNVTFGAYDRLGTLTTTYMAPPQGAVDRTDVDDSGNVVLPGPWLEGVKALELDIVVREVRSGPNLVFDRLLVNQEFNESYVPNIYSVMVNENTTSNPNVTTTNERRAIHIGYQRVMPVPQANYIPLGWPVLGPQPGASNSQLISALDQLGANIASSNPPSQVGSTPPPVDQVFGTTERGGGLSDPGWGGGRGVASWGSIGSSSGWFVMAHEMNHNIGNNTWGRHVGNNSADKFVNGCGAGGPDQRWQQIHPQNTYTFEIGFDPRFPNSLVADDHPELMSYCTSSQPRKWISPYRWNRTLARFESLTPGTPVHPDTQSGSGGGSPDAPAEGPGREVADRRVPTVRTVAGELHRDGSGSLDSSFERPGLYPGSGPATPAKHPDAHLVVGYEGGEEARFPIVASFTTPAGEEVDTSPFVVPLADNGTIRSLRLVGDGDEVLDRREHRPWSLDSAEWSVPEEMNREEPNPIAADLAAEADGRLQRRLVYQPDPELPDLPYGIGFDGDEALASFEGLPGGDQARFLLMVSDGLHTEYAASPTFSVPPAPPSLSLDRGEVVAAEFPDFEEGDREASDALGPDPAGFETVPDPVEVPAGAPASIRADARDRMGRPIEGPDVRWTVRPAEGGPTLATETGAAFDHVFGSAGEYQVTALATDPRTGATASRTVPVQVHPPPLPNAEDVQNFWDRLYGLDPGG